MENFETSIFEEFDATPRSVISEDILKDLYFKVIVLLKLCFITNLF